MKWAEEKVVTLDGEIAGELEEDVFSWRARFDKPAFSRVCRVIMPPIIEIWRGYCTSIIYGRLLKRFTFVETCYYSMIPPSVTVS